VDLLKKKCVPKIKRRGHMSIATIPHRERREVPPEQDGCSNSVRFEFSYCLLGFAETAIKAFPFRNMCESHPRLSAKNTPHRKRGASYPYALNFYNQIRDQKYDIPGEGTWGGVGGGLRWNCALDLWLGSRHRSGTTAAGGVETGGKKRRPS